jgi:DNA gyrase/topoisomerase IV subunit A
VLNNLFKLTPLQNNFNAYMLALVNGEPVLLTLRKMLQVFLDFRIETIERRTRYLLRKAEERDHILLGLLIALDNLDAIIDLIRAAADTASARQGLMSEFGLSEAQADAILQMQLRRLTALEADKIRLEHEDLLAKITDYQDILARKDRVLGLIVEELGVLRARYISPRRTEILDLEGGLEDIDLIANERSVVMLTENGYLKRMPVSEFEATSRGTRGKAGTRTQGEEAVRLFKPKPVRYECPEDWDKVRKIRDAWGGKFILKGILDVEDAQRAADFGADAIIVSNHGGRQLDGALSSIRMLPSIARAVGDRVEVHMDGGIRSGQDVLKALALGAKGTYIGRSYIYGLGAMGQAGVTAALEVIQKEMDITLALLGEQDVRNVRRENLLVPRGFEGDWS